MLLTLARHSAQTAFGIAILGIGPIVSGVFNGWLDLVGQPAGAQGLDAFTSWWRGVLESFGAAPPADGTGYEAIWWTLAVVGLFAGLLVFIAFTDDSDKSSALA